MPSRARSARPTGPQGLLLPAAVATQIRDGLPGVADAVVAAIIEEVPGYTDAFNGPMGQTIRQAVQIALGGFLSLASGRRGTDPRTPTAPAVDGAYQLGRGEARSGRSTEAILSAYRIGARVSWQQMAQGAVRAGLDAETLASFAALVFAYIDELSAASVAGHADELATTGRVREQRLERLAHHLVTGSPEDTVWAAAERADWPAPRTLSAVVTPESQVRPLLAALSPLTLQAADPPGLDDGVLLLVPDAHGRSRARLLRAVAERGATAGPPRPWLAVRASYERALRARTLGLGPDTEEHLPALVLTADPEALADLRTRALAPLADLRPGTVDKLAETLRLWLLLQGRRDEVAAALFVHPQTVRYRMGQVREAYGDTLDDPQVVLALTLALGVPPVASDE
ncbi:PucR family transcriptional regulator [Nocardioides rubriscoriae]|uniref:PucR family transcriptional regulator n=1 Tax=Nocardioides rubriscoriae TaxID=642762 RepID=UPI0011E04A20|nr:helix-turn-helix domain-containing protein [Nocardioides rubriscoriae]